SLFFFYNYSDHPKLLSFPTRRSSDLIGPFRQNGLDASGKDLFKDYAADRAEIIEAAFSLNKGESAPVIETADSRFLAVRADGARSEEHTSELQSRENLVCRLLLEKKN